MAIQEIKFRGRYGLQVGIGQGRGEPEFLEYDKNGGKAKTRALARMVEQLMFATHGIDRQTGMAYPSKSNKSGLIGIRLEWRTGRRFRVLYLVATSRPKSGPHTRAWSLDRNDFDEALRESIEWRFLCGHPEIDFKAAKKTIWPYFQRKLRE